jgi:site-specific DNA-methyltransferase (adenine-specific)
MIGIGGHTGGDVTTSGIKYDDDFEASMAKISVLANESIRFVKPTGFAFVFCAISYFWLVRTMFESAGWDCSSRPIIWIKNESGQNNAPDKWMSSAYECMLFARRIDSKILIEGKVDWIQSPNVVPSLRIHQAEKPVVVIKEMLGRVTLPGSVVFDPFAGSGATIRAALDLKMYPIGCENVLDSYAVAVQSIEKYLIAKGE